MKKTGVAAFLKNYYVMHNLCVMIYRHTRIKWRV